MAVSIVNEPDYTKQRLVIDLERQLDPTENATIMRKAIEKVAEDFANKWLEENRADIEKQLDTKTLAKLAEVHIDEQLLNKKG